MNTLKYMKMLSDFVTFIFETLEHNEKLKFARVNKKTPKDLNVETQKD